MDREERGARRVIGRAELERMLDEAGATYTSRRIPAGAMVFWSGEPDGNHYYVESGSVELGVDAAGRKKVIDRYGRHILRIPYPARHQSDDVDGAVLGGQPHSGHSKESFFKLLRGGSISPNTACAICSGFCPCRPTRC
ncbi:MAG: hypothetical protein ACLUW6_06660 [Coriobacteriaceae bacterium]